MSAEDTKQSYRYNLTALSQETGKETNYGIEISDDIPYITDRKSLLAEIDLFTMRSKDINDLAFQFLRAGELDDDATFYIVYKSTKKEIDSKGNHITRSIDKKASVLYEEDKNVMLPFAEELSSNVNQHSDHFYTMYNEVLAKNTEWLDWMKKHRYITKELYYKLNKNKQELGSNTFLQNQISEELSSYKTIRNIYVGNKEYERRFEKEEILYDGEVDMTASDIYKRLNEALDIITETEVEDESYKDYSDEEWHR